MDDECWNEPSEIRIRVLVRLKAICQEILGMDKVPPAFWAFCQVADIAKLEEMIQDLESTNNTRLAQRALEPTIMDCSAAIDRWLQRLSVSKSSSHPSNHSERSDTETRNCKKRDNHNCVLTRTPDPDAAHIYPNSLLNASKREPNAAARFWSIMNVFWDEGRVQRWKAGIFCDENNPEKPRYGCFNLLSLDKLAQALWGDGRFALRPMETADSRTLKVQFFWQKGLPNPAANVDLLTTPDSSRGLYDSNGRSLAMLTGICKDTGVPIYKAIASGDVFTITTDNPKSMPLPSQALLEIQWHLQRITGMSGAAEAMEGNSDFDGDDGDTTAVHDDAVERTRRIYDWLGIFTYNDESFAVQQPPIEVRHATMDS